MNENLDQRHDDLAAAVLAALSGLRIVAALLTTVISATGHPVLVGVGLAALALAVAAARWIAQRMRERREDAADALAAQAWRSEHMPHLGVVLDSDHIPTDQRERAGVA
jgi:hypothetical protein